MKEWFSASELAALKLPALPSAQQNIKLWAKRESWKTRKRSGAGGGSEYPISALPPEAQDALLERILKTSAPAKAAPLPPQNTADLKDYQRKVMDARAAILMEVDRLTALTSRISAVLAVVDASKNGTLRPDLQELVPIANAKSRAGSSLSRPTLYRWLAARRDHGAPGLAVQAVPETSIPEWASALMDLYARPQKPSLAFCVERLQAEYGDDAPSYDQAKRFLRKLDTISRNKGRMGPRELKRLKAFVRRDTSELWPTAVYSADGHTSDAEVAHPIHGRPFRPEITTIIDIYTRRVVGWSVGLAETTWGTLDAIRHAFQTSGVCDIWYVDRGKGFNNAVFDAELTGVLARFGVTKSNSLPYNSQARGVIERVHQSLWIRGAKTLPTYMGADMDPEARQRAFKITRADIKKTGQSRLLMTWPDFLAWVAEQVLTYNQRPHSSLPKIRDAVNGRVRDMCPNELWMQAVDDGFEADIIANDEADLFRPYAERVVQRAEVNLFGNTYFAAALEGYHGEQVLVGYDIHDANRVWVRDREQRLICIAEFGGNKRSYFPVSAMQQASETRAKGRRLRLAEKAYEVEVELNPSALLEAVNEPLSAEEIESGDQMFAALEARAAEPEPMLRLVDGRPHFDSEYQWAMWLSLHPDQATADDAENLAHWLRNASFKQLLLINGVDVGTLQSITDTDAINSSRE